MRVVVTGGDGFIGRALLQRLTLEGHSAYSFDRSTGDDVTDAEAVNQALGRADACIHLAGVLGTDELFDVVYDAVRINVLGVVNVLDACVRQGASYVGIPMLPVFPSVYTATKVCAHRLATAYHHAHGLPTSHVQAFNAYGPDQAYGQGHPRKIIPALAVEGWSGLPLQVWGDGEQTVDLVHVDDLANVLSDALHVHDDSVIDGGTGVAMTVNEVAELVLQVTGSTAGIEHLPMRRGEVPQKLRAEGLGWHLLRPENVPIHSLDRIAQVVESYRSHPLVAVA